MPTLLLLVSVGLFRIMPLLGIGGLMLAFLVLVARFDNQSGTFLSLAALFVLVLLVMALLLGALAYVHAMMSGVR